MADEVQKPRKERGAKRGRAAGEASQFLTRREISMIDEALERAQPNGEVVLTVQRGRLRFISVTEDRSPDA